MKVYSSGITPPSLFNQVNQANRVDQDFKTYMDQLKQYAINLGYIGPLTGKIAGFGVADGYAIYMYCDSGRNSCLLHSEFADGYGLSHIESITRSGIISLLRDY